MKKRNVKRILLIPFAVYLLTLISLLFFAGRQSDMDISFGEFVRDSVNLVPFRSIGIYLSVMQRGVRHASASIVHFCGNIVGFAPFAFFLPFYSKKAQKAGGFLLIMLGIILGLEAVQLLTRRGSFDIDDLLLNLLGAMAASGLLRGAGRIVRKRKGHFKTARE